MTQEDERSALEAQEAIFFTAWAQVRQQGMEANFKLAHAFGMSATQFTLLGLLERAEASEPQTISRLAAQMGLDPATVVRSVDLLENRGLVQRRRATRDRRQVFVELTDEGRAVQQQLRDRFSGRLSRILRSMSEEGRGDLLRGLDEFLSIGRRVDEEDTPSP